MSFAFLGTETADAWEEWRGRNYEVRDENGARNEDRGVILASTPAYVSGGPVIADPPPGLEAVDIALDECRVLHVLGADSEIYEYDRSQEILWRLPCTWVGGEDGGFGEPRALCLTEQTIYVAGGEDGYVHAISRHLLQTRWIANRPYEQPVGLATDGRVVYVLDRGSETDTADGFLATVGPDGERRDVVTGLESPGDLAVDDGGNVYVLDERSGDPVIRKFGSDGTEATDGGYPLDTFREIGTSKPFNPTCLAAVSETEPVVGAGPEDVGGKPRFPLFAYRPGAAKFERLGCFERGFRRLLTDRRPGGEVRGFFAIDGSDGTVHSIEKAPRTKRNEATGNYDAQVWTRLDAGGRGTEWHRVTMGLSVEEPGTQVHLSYRTTDKREMGDITEITAIERGDVHRIQDAGVTDLWELLALSPEEIAGIIEISLNRAMDWLDRTREQLGAEGDLEELVGVGPTYAERLQEVGITRRSQLLGRDPEELADLTGVPSSQTVEWIDQAREQLGTANDLQEVAGIGPTFARRLRSAGITRRSQLLEHAPEVIVEHAGISTDRAATWLDQGWALLEGEWERAADPLERPNPRDTLLEAAQGRYLFVKIDLIGSEFASPRVESFRAYFPRQSYLRYLPAVYREDERSAAFLERFLSIFESVTVDVEEEIESVTRYLDPNGIPAEYLSWLGRWLAIETDEPWPESGRRELIERAPELFRKRGTREGLLETVRIYLEHADRPSVSWSRAREREAETIERLGSEGHLTDEEAKDARERHAALATELPDQKQVYLLEYSALDCIDEEAVRVPYEALLGCPQCFLVLARLDLDDEQLRTVGRIVDSQTPAHAVGRAAQLRPWIRLGDHSYLGINSALSGRDLVVERSSLGRDSVLLQREEHSHLGLRSRLGDDTVMS